MTNGLKTSNWKIPLRGGYYETPKEDKDDQEAAETKAEILPQYYTSLHSKLTKG